MDCARRHFGASRQSDHQPASEKPASRVFAESAPIEPTNKCAIVMAGGGDGGGALASRSDGGDDDGFARPSHRRTTPRRFRSEPAPNFPIHGPPSGDSSKAFTFASEGAMRHHSASVLQAHAAQSAREMKMKIQTELKRRSDGDMRIRLSVNVTRRRRSVFAEPLFINDSQSPICEFCRKFWEQ
jgi:hypothetical protein